MIKNIQQNSNDKKQRIKKGIILAKSSQFLKTSGTINLRTGMPLKTDAEIFERIKAKRVHSYKQISFSIRKMDTIFKGKGYNQKIKIKETPSYEKMLVNSSAVLRNKCKQKLKTDNIEAIKSIKNASLRLQTCSNFYQSGRKNIIFRSDLLGQNHQPSEARIKTEYTDDKQKMKVIEKELMNIQSPCNRYNLAKGKTQQNGDNFVNVLNSQNQQTLILQRKGLPGVQFKKSYSNFHQNTNKCGLTESTHNKTYSLLDKSQSNYFHFDQLLRLDKSQKIEQMYELRHQSSIYDQPKQWHLYNCLKLNQLSLYRTNLKLSCENWILIDHLQLKYLRGWQQKELKQFRLGIKLFLTNVMMHLKDEMKLDFNRIKIRINNDVIYRKMEFKDRNQHGFSLKDNTILSLWDLYIGVVTTANVDILWHLIYSLSFLYQNNLVRDQLEEIYFQNSINNKNYQQIFILLCRDIADRLNFKEIQFQMKVRKAIVMKNQRLLIGEQYRHSELKEQNQIEYLYMKASCVDIAILFLQCFSHVSFRNLIQNKSDHQISIRYQVGNRFWQNRSHQWHHNYKNQKVKGNHLLLDKNTNGQMCMIAYNSIYQTITICNDCKTNMSIKDGQSIIRWMKGTFKRFQPLPVTRQTIIIENRQAGQ